VPKRGTHGLTRPVTSKALSITLPRSRMIMKSRPTTKLRLLLGIACRQVCSRRRTYVHQHVTSDVRLCALCFLSFFRGKNQGRPRIYGYTTVLLGASSGVLSRSVTGQITASRILRVHERCMLRDVQVIRSHNSRPLGKHRCSVVVRITQPTPHLGLGTTITHVQSMIRNHRNMMVAA